MGVLAYIVLPYDKAIFERMSDDDREVFRKYAEMGNRSLMVDGSPLLDTAATIALTHHERKDGSGYPPGLSGEDIPLVGRIVAFAGVFTNRRFHVWHWLVVLLNRPQLTRSAPGNT